MRTWIGTEQGCGVGNGTAPLGLLRTWQNAMASSPYRSVFGDRAAQNIGREQGSSLGNSLQSLPNNHRSLVKP